MTKVVDLNVMVPEDIVFKYGADEYTVPGDLDTDNVLRLFKLFGELIENAALDKLESAETDDDGALDEETRRIAARVRADLLAIFQLRQPDLEALPFGAMSTRIILREILAGLGVLAHGGDGDDDASPSKARPRKKTAARSRSSRSPRR